MEFPLYARFNSRGSIVRFISPKSGICVKQGNSDILSTGQFATKLNFEYEPECWTILTPSPLEVKILDIKYKKVLDDYHGTRVSELIE